MKNLLFILIFAFALQSYAQDQQLFDDTWYLQKLTIDNNEIFPPNIMPEFTETNFVSETLLVTGYCDQFGCEIIFNGDNSFDVQNITYIGFSCNHPDDFFFNNTYSMYMETGITNPLFYDINTLDGIRYLEFTNVDGDNALYANQLLNIEDPQLSNLALYPNPAKDQLYISGRGVDITSLRVIELNGKVVKEIDVAKYSSALNVQNLTSGIYFLELDIAVGEKQLLRFIKE